METNNNLTERFFVLCEPCGYRKILDSRQDNGMVEIKTPDIPGGVPQLDPANNKVIKKAPLKRMPKVKCPKCGRGTVLRKLPEVYVQSYKEIDKQEQEKRIQAERQKRILDGLPPKREKQEPDFLG